MNRKRLIETLPSDLLSKKLEYITAMDFRESPGDVLLQAQLGKIFIITRHGKSVAMLQRLPGTTLTINVDSKGNISYGL